MEYVYPATFTQNDDASYTITFTDLPGCISEGKSLESAVYMAERALTQWLSFLKDEQQSLPAASDIKKIKPNTNQFISLVRANVRSNKAVRRTISLPEWMDAEANKAGISLSKVTQDALKEYLHIQE